MDVKGDLAEHLVVGLVATIHPAGRTDPVHRYLTVIRGWRKDAFITLDLPIVSARFIPVKKDLHCVVRFFANGRACGFDARVLSVNPSIENPYLQVTWPDQFESVAVRRFERIPTHIAGTIAFEGVGDRRCEIVDLSAGGCRVVTDADVGPVKQVRLSFALPDATWLEDVKAIVRNIKKLADAVALGCEFEKEENLARTSSAFYVSTTLERLRAADAPNRRLLVIEKDPAVVDVIRTALEPKGYEIVSAPNMVDGFYRLRMLPPRALLINHDLKELPPIEVCKLVRESSGFQKLPIFVYGGEDADLQRRARDLGLTGYITSVDMLTELANALAHASDEDPSP